MTRSTPRFALVPLSSGDHALAVFSPYHGWVAVSLNLEGVLTSNLVESLIPLEPMCSDNLETVIARFREQLGMDTDTDNGEQAA